MIDRDIVRKRGLFDRELIGQMFVYVRRYGYVMAAAVVLSLLTVGANSCLPLIVRRAIDHYMLAGPEQALSVAERYRGLSHLALFYLGLAGVAFLLRYVQGYAISWMGQKVMFDVRRDLFTKALRLPLSFYDRNPVGRLMTRVTSDVQSMQRAMTEGAVSLVADVLALFGIIAFMVYLNAWLAFYSLLVLPLVAGVVTLVNFLIRKAQRIERRERSEMSAYLQESITGMATIQLFSRQASAREQFGEANRRVRDASVKAVIYLSYFFPSIELLGAVTLVTILGVGGWMMLNEVGGVTVGILVAFIAYMRDLFRPLEDLAEKTNNLQTAMASGERVFDLMEKTESIRDPEQPERLDDFQGEVVFDRVWFAYQDEDWVLRDVSFRAEPGTSLALVGATGAGKTSVVSLLARFYDVQQGAVRIDGHDVRHLKLADLRQCVGIVLQDPFVFSGTVLNNIGLHRPDLSREELIEAARFVNAEPFISELPEGFDTRLTERGSELSTGQKQLLALARAVAQNPDILLILDEATANVDTETEALIQDALKRLMKGRTSILIAHRLSTIQHVDRIVVMRHGELVEQGSHRELIDQDGYYRKLYELLFQGRDAGGDPP